MNACVHDRCTCRFWSAVRIVRISSNLSRKWTRKKTHRFINHSAYAKKARYRSWNALDPLHSEFAFVPLKWHIFVNATNTDRFVVEAAGKKTGARKCDRKLNLSAVYEDSGFSQRVSIARFSLCVFVNKKRHCWWFQERTIQKDKRECERKSIVLDIIFRWECAFVEWFLTIINIAEKLACYFNLCDNAKNIYELLIRYYSLPTWLIYYNESIIIHFFLIGHCTSFFSKSLIKMNLIARLETNKRRKRWQGEIWSNSADKWECENAQGILRYETVLVTWLHNIDLHRVQDCGTWCVHVTEAVPSNPILAKGTHYRVTFPSSITQEANVVAMTALWSIKQIRSNKYLNYASDPELD